MDPRTRTFEVARISRDQVASSGVADELAIEEPLAIEIVQGDIARTISITMRTPGHDEELGVGYLVAEGFVRTRQDVTATERCGKPVRNVVRVTLRQDAPLDLHRLERHTVTSSACGVCGKTSLEALETADAPALPSFEVHSATLSSLPAILASHQSVFRATGGLHAAALFTSTGQLVSIHEDIGRHNAVDKVIGGELLAGRVPLASSILLVSGRASFELVQKAVMAGAGVLAAVGAPSSLAVELAARHKLTLAGFLRDDRYNIYAAPERITF